MKQNEMTHRDISQGFYTTFHKKKAQLFTSIKIFVWVFGWVTTATNFQAFIENKFQHMVILHIILHVLYITKNSLLFSYFINNLTCED
jgi:hypothetical protein